MTSTEQLQAEANGFKQDLKDIQDEVGKCIVGQERVIESVVTAILCGGNVLLEGVPGLGKTELVKALSRVLELQFSRIQFTPDLMPADIVGTNVMSTDGTGKYQFEFRRGPIFTQLLLADEINRATPKTQSALLETMQEGTVTIPGETFRLEQPFFVLATQNPLEQEGTYPLPEAQLDRFLFKVEVPFPERSDLNEIVSRTILRQPVPLERKVDGPKIMSMRTILDKVVVADPIRDYAVRLVMGSHPGSDFAPPRVRQFISWGASPRAAQAMIRAGRVRALSEGRAHLAFADVRHYAREVLQHRMILNYDGQAESIDMSSLVQDIVSETVEEV
jgi:MoxR-like ATPase